MSDPVSESPDRNTVVFGEYISHRFINDTSIESREYQEVLIRGGLTDSSLIALPTGTGKTVVSTVITAERLVQIFGSRSLFVAPTKPLVEQQAEFYQEVLDIPAHEIVVFTGDIRPQKRKELWESAVSIVFATPQVIQNDLISGRISLDDVSHITFDECHRATGDYAYTFIAEKYWQQAQNPLVTGLSASPGSNRDDILEVSKNLGVTNIEVIDESDPLLEPYIHTTEIEPRFIDVGAEIQTMLDTLTELYRSLLTKLKSMEVLSSRSVQKIGYRQLQAGMTVARNMDSSDKYTALSLLSEAMKIDQALEMLETQGVSALETKLDQFETDANQSDSSKAVKRLISRPEFEQLKIAVESYSQTHPKQSELIISLHEPIMNGDQAIVFTQYRETARRLVERLNELTKISAHRFVGQNNSDGDGMNQAEQKQVITKFKQGTYNVLVATSVAEEGLDIPQVGLVVFYEPVPSGIRAIQRRGRTGRASSGRVVVLIASGTRDEGYWYASKSKEKSMKSNLTELANIQSDIAEELQSKQQTLTDTPTSTPKSVTNPDASTGANDPTESKTTSDDGTVTIITDTREGASKIPRELALDQLVTVKQEQLEVGDFILSERVGIERKSTQDFADTIVGGDRSLFEQIGDLTKAYDRPVLIIEGTQDSLHTARNIHSNAIRGTLVSVAVDFGVSMLWTRDQDETIEVLKVIAKREQTKTNTTVSAHGSKSTQTQTDEQEYIISAFSGIGSLTAELLLEEFGSIHAVLTASKDDLTTINGIGSKTADKLYDLTRAEYNAEV